MKRLVVFTAAAFLLFAAMRTAEPVPAFGVEVKVAPSSLDGIQLLDRQTPWSYTARAIVSDIAGARRVYAAPVVIVAPGKHESTTQRAGDYMVTFTVAVSEKKDRAATEVVLEKDGAVVHRQKSDFVLQASAVQPQPKR